MMVSGTEGETALGKIGPCGICEKKGCIISRLMQCVAHCAINGYMGDVPK